MKCPKCRQKMHPIEGRIEVTVGENLFACNSDAWRCDPCNINLAQLQVRVQPIKCEPVVISPVAPFEKITEGEGNA